MMGILAGDLRHLRGVRGADLDLAGQKRVVPERLAHESVAPGAEHTDEPVAADRVHLGRHPPDGRVDCPVGEPDPELGRGVRLPDLLDLGREFDPSQVHLQPVREGGDGPEYRLM